MNEILEIAKYVLPSLVVLATTYILIRNFLDIEHKRKLVDVKVGGQKIITPIRLQAYERLALLLERISPSNLVIRVSKSKTTAQQLQMDLMNNVRSEFDHNLSQQVYVSDEAWEMVKNSKEEIIKMITIAVSKLPEEATGKDLCSVLLEMEYRTEKLPTTAAIEYLKNEVRQMF
ncbi:MAG: hypothetical protein PHD97_02445 [Bacteroidales bacterium]|nr:hypothetical protein [Bacteroidales bacterium]